MVIVNNIWLNITKEFKKDYLNHNFIADVKNEAERCKYFICDRCNNTILCYYMDDHFIWLTSYISMENNLVLMTCEEEIIKSIIE